MFVPCTASVDPMACRLGCHCEGFTTYVVTAGGGGVNTPAAAAACKPRIFLMKLAANTSKMTSRTSSTASR